MNNRIAALLSDILLAGARIQQFVKGLTFAEYVSNPLVRSAVERQFEIIGEALLRLARHQPEMFARIPEARRIIDFRNVLAHGYDIVDDEIVWQAVHNHLPPFLDVVNALLEEIGSSGEGVQR